MGMNKKRDKLLEKKITFIFVLVAFCMGFYLIINSLSYGTEKNDMNFDREFSNEWMLEIDALNIYQEVDLPYINKDNPINSRMRITKRIPDKYLSNPSILFGASQQKVKVYVDGDIIYTFETLKNSSYDKTNGSGWLTVALPKDCFGKELTIEYESSFKNVSGLITSIYYGNRNDHLLTLMKSGINKVILAVILVVIGITVAIFALRLMDLNMDKAMGLFYLTAGIFSMSVWLTVDSEYISLIYNNFAFNYYVEYICMLLIPVLYFLFIYKMSDIKCNKIIAQCQFAMFFIFLVFQAAGVIDFFTMEGFFWDVTLTNLVISTLTIFKRGKVNKELRQYILTNVIMIIFALSEISIYNINLINKAKSVVYFCTITLLINLIYKFYSSYFEIYYSKVENRYLQKQIESQIKHYNNLDKSYSVMRKYRHDMKNHLICIEHLFNSGEIDKANEYIFKVNEALSNTKYIFETGNPVLDAIITEKRFIAVNKGIEFNTDIMISKDIKIETIDWCIIFGNALDNAIEACKKIEDEKKIINVNLFSRNNMFIVNIINSSRDDIVLQDERYMTTKKNKDEHGIGMKNIEDSIKKYDGVLSTKYEDGLFHFSVVFYDV